MVRTRTQESLPHVVLATGHGGGVGHLARQAAVAFALSESVEPVLFSLSPAVHFVTRHGLRAEYCPSVQRNWMPHLSWHDYLGQRIRALLDETQARVFVFDGAAPYLGILRMRASCPDVAFVWVRPGMWRPGTKRMTSTARPFFDLVVQPGDFAAAADRGPTAGLTDAVPIGPITLLEQVPALPRPEAAAILGLDPDRPTALVSLGPGSSGSSGRPALTAIKGFLSTPDWQVAVTCAPKVLGDLPREQASRVIPLHDVYPLARYLRAFDAAVSAAGYNAVQELLSAAIPTAFVPAGSATDDQEARATYLATKGLALSADGSVGAVMSAVGCLVDTGGRKALADACAALPPATGASTLAELLRHLGEDFAGHRRSHAERIQSANLAVRVATMRARGPSGSTAFRHARNLLAGAGATPTPTPPAAEPPAVSRPMVTHQLDPALLGGTNPVEHLLPGTSGRYRNRRLTIAHDFYDWPVEVAAATVAP